MRCSKGRTLSPNRRLRLTRVSRLPIRLPQRRQDHEDSHGEAQYRSDQDGQLGRYWLLLRQEEEPAYQDREAGDEGVRYGRAQARRVQGTEDQVGRRNGRNDMKRGRKRGPFSLDEIGRASVGERRCQ